MAWHVHWQPVQLACSSKCTVRGWMEHVTAHRVWPQWQQPVQHACSSAYSAQRACGVLHSSHASTPPQATLAHPQNRRDLGSRWETACTHPGGQGPTQPSQCPDYTRKV